MLADLFYNNDDLEASDEVTFVSYGTGNNLIKPPPPRNQSGFVGLENQYGRSPLFVFLTFIGGQHVT
jgi:hypothetical protein